MGYLKLIFNPLNAELNPTRHLLALVGARHIVHVSRLRVKVGHFVLSVRRDDPALLFIQNTGCVLFKHPRKVTAKTVIALPVFVRPSTLMGKSSTPSGRIFVKTYIRCFLRKNFRHFSISLNI